MGRLGTLLKEKAPGLHRFLNRRDGKWPLLRELLAGILVLGLLVSLLYGLTGQGMPFGGGYPVVVVTTGSMMHCENGMPPLGSDCDPTNWGRLGTIDPGDLVFVRSIDEPSDVATMAEDGRSHYGHPGDVIVYRPNGNAAATPIIHRAMFWVQAEPDGTYSVPAYGISHARRLDDPRLLELVDCPRDDDLTNTFDAYRHAFPDPSGFVTRGDNNGNADACAQAPGVARLDWVLGKARGEVPWVGLVNLLYGDMRSGTSHFGEAGSDSKTMFFVTIAVLVAAPWVIEVFVRRRRRRRADEEGD